MLLAVVVHAANIQDRDGAKLLLGQLRWRFPRLETLFADCGYAGKLVDWMYRMGGWTLEIVRRGASPRGFQVLPKRWIVERTFAWLNRSRRLSKDYEERTDTQEAFIHLAMIHLMIKRLQPNV